MRESQGVEAAEELEEEQITGLTKGSLACRTSHTFPSRPLEGSPKYRTN